jgi:hypothetical protein
VYWSSTGFHEKYRVQGYRSSTGEDGLGVVQLYTGTGVGKGYRSSTGVRVTRVEQVCWDTVVIQGYRRFTDISGTGELEEYRSRTGVQE